MNTEQAHAQKTGYERVISEEVKKLEETEKQSLKYLSEITHLEARRQAA